MLDKNTTNPGYHKQFVTYRFNPEESKILHQLSKGWYLTNAGEDIRVAQSQYSYFLMKPTKLVAEMFNIEREIVCVFSDYENFEPRSIDVFDKIITTLPKMRVETVCEILISRNKDIEDKVEKLLKSDPEHPIVIPISYEDLSRPDALKILENRFRKHFYSRDLFAFLSPLKKDTYFFGRSNLINDIVNKYKSGEHTSLFGLRKSGKTSIVYAIERRLYADGHPVLSIDCESPSIHLLRWNELLEKLVLEYAKIKNPSLKINTFGRYGEKNASESFEQDVTAIFNSSKKISTLFVFDEIERLTPETASSEHWKTGTDFIYFWQTLRGFYQKNPGIFCYLLAGTNPNCIESAYLAGHENPIYASISSQYVPPFSIEQVSKMVSTLGDYMGIKFDEILYAKLTDDFGGHPFLIRQMCSLISQNCSQTRPVKVDKALYNKCKIQFNKICHDYIEMMVHVLKDWYPDEYEMLSFLAQGDDESFNTFAKGHMHYTRHLVGYGLIQESSNGYAFNLESLAEILRNIHAHERLNLTQDEKLEEISARRNALEKNLRFTIKNSLRVTYGAQKAAAQVVSAIPEPRRPKLQALTLNSLLDKDKSPLFFLDLVAVISREWECLKNVFSIEKTKLILMLEEINLKGRPEAHAKSIEDDDFTQLRLYFKKLEEMFLDLEN